MIREYLKEMFQQICMRRGWDVPGFLVIKGATHYYQVQPELQRQATRALTDRLGARSLFD